MLCFINQRHRKLGILLFNPLPHREICRCIYKVLLHKLQNVVGMKSRTVNLELTVNKRDEQLPR